MSLQEALHDLEQNLKMCDAQDSFVLHNANSLTECADITMQWMIHERKKVSSLDVQRYYRLLTSIREKCSLYRGLYVSIQNMRGKLQDIRIETRFREQQITKPKE